MREQPRMELTDVCRNWTRPPVLESLLHVIPTHPISTLAFQSRGLDGEITGYREESLAALPKTALNSTALDRRPGNAVSFVRGKSSNFPFRPGGLGDIGLEEEDVDLVHSADQMEKAFEKGRGQKSCCTK